MLNRPVSRSVQLLQELTADYPGLLPEAAAAIAALAAIGHENAALRPQNLEGLGQSTSSIALALAAAGNDDHYYWPGSNLFGVDPAIALAGEPAHVEFSRLLLVSAVRRIEDIHNGRIAYAADRAFAPDDCHIIARAARVGALRDEKWYGEIIPRLLPLVCVAPTSAKTLPSQSLAIALGHSIEGVPTPESVHALRTALGVIRHAGVKKKLLRNIKPAERALAERSDIVRAAPDLGLDASGSLTLDFGPRTFLVGFDETLKPFVKDRHGTRLKDLPKPIKSDDAAQATAAVERYKQLKKDIKAVAGLQITLLELGMIARKRWPVAEFTSFFLHHPLMRHIAMRLVWGVYAGGELVQGFRVAEDWTLADQDDKLYALHEDAQVGVMHVLDMPDAALTAFGQIFADYEILQPFKQLGRETYALDSEESEASVLTRFKDKAVSVGSLMGLAARGWKRGEAEDGGWIGSYSKRLGADLDAVLALDPGVHVSDMRSMPRQLLPSIMLHKRGTWGNGIRMPFSSLDRIAASEILRDIELLAPFKE